MVQIIWKLLVLILYVTLAFVSWLLWRFYIKPVIVRSRYRKHKNVFMGKGFYTPILGDFLQVKKNLENDEYLFNHLIQDGINSSKARFQNRGTDKYENEKDIQLIQFGDSLRISAISTKAVDELNKIPTTICDRTQSEFHALERAAPKSFTIVRTNQNWKKRREAFVRSMKLNYVSKNIPMVMKALEDKVATWKEGQEINFSDEMKEVTFKVILTILFGANLFDKIEKVGYEQEDGTIVQKSIPNALNDLFHDHNSMFNHWLFLASPSIAEFLNIPIMRRNKTNRDEIYRVLRNFLKKDADKDSVYQRVMTEHGLTEEEALQDTVFFLSAGLDTTASGITSTIYLLKKYPETYQKLRKELEEAGVTKDSDFSDPEVQEAVSNCSYLYYVFKEMTRIDTPVTGSLLRVALKDFKLCEVPIPKGALVTFSFLHNHVNYEHWYEPTKFIPERFDPDHPYFNNPVDQKSRRNPTIHSPFGFGLRKCPGQVLATLETKFMVAKLVLMMDYDVAKDQLTRDHMKFSFISHHRLRITYKGML
ncbi:unnamed protein product [Moneuplotes crassus]|uniref:Cytochrome P450 n=1 Tax=Euplotes crassus TaxID=5936 RepID=A0AAD1U8I8_EUPCR|nr:unnamed protein product [Moneuplotes crassus]